MANGTDRVVLISGASTGIGRAVAELLASRGYQVLAGVRAPATRYRMRRPIGQAALLYWLRRLLPARMFEPSLRKAFALDPSSEIAGTQLSNQR
jgi:NADPH:quinone reductase-like Zn-dependent oxidoreductase